MNLRALYPIYCRDKGVSHTCLSLCRAMEGGELGVELWVPTSAPGIRYPLLRNAVPPALGKLVYRFDILSSHLTAYLAWRYFRSLRGGDIAYLFPGVALSFYREAKERGAYVVTERINCHQATSKRILDDAYRHLGWPTGHKVTDDEVAAEREELERADFIFAPSPLVAQSLLDDNIPEEKVLRASYGWSPARFTGTNKALPSSDGLTVLFVGRGSVRKGIPLLLDIWEEARVKGRLVLVGGLAEDVVTRCADKLNRPDVIRFAAQDDIAAFYRSADLFVLPTLEEGSPLVSYEAMACGLPSLVSPMGAGELIRDGKEGLVLDPYDRDAWVAALRRLAADAELRRELGRAARERVQDFTWDLAGKRRRELLLGAVRRSS